MASLLSLPNELVLLIADSLRDEALLALASTSTRLNHLLIRTLFARSEIAPYAECLSSGHIPVISLRGDEVFALRTLAVARAITSVQHIFVDLYSPRTISTWQNYLLAVDALCMLATRLTYIGAVNFNPYFSLGYMRTEAETGQCVRKMAELLNALAVREEGTLLTVHGGVFSGDEEQLGGGRPFVHSIEQVVRGESVSVFSNARPPTPSRRNSPAPSTSSRRLPTIVQRVLRALGSLLALPRRLLRPAPANPRPHVQRPSLPPPDTETRFTSSPRPSPHASSILTTLPLSSTLRLTTLHIHSSHLLRAHLLPYTTLLLNSAPIHTLSLGNAHTQGQHTRELELVHYDWALILPTLTIPRLATLRIGAGVDIAVPDLMRFLRRHAASIADLDLSGHTPRGSLVLAEDVGLPRLRVVRAASEYLLHFFSVAFPPSATGSGEQGEEQHHPYAALRLVDVTSDDVSAYGLATYDRLLERLEALAAAAGPLRVERHGAIADARVREPDFAIDVVGRSGRAAERDVDSCANAEAGYLPSL